MNTKGMCQEGLGEVSSSIALSLSENLVLALNWSGFRGVSG